MNADDPVPEKAKVLVLRTCNADRTSHNGFLWPEGGPVSAPDWNPEVVCGYGLHGFLWGEGDGSLANWTSDAKWLVAEVERESIVDLAGKVKFPSATVVFCGDRLGATSYLAEHGGHGRAIVGGTATAGNRGTATAGDEGTATAGDAGTATAGYAGTATAGYRGTIQAKWWDSSANRYRIATGYIGEDGLLPNVKYRWDNGKWTQVETKEVAAR